MCDPTLITLLKMQPCYSQSSHENATPSSGTSLLASYKEVPPGPSQNYYLCWMDHLVVKSSFNRRTEVFSFYIICEMFRANVDSVSFCVFIFITWYVMPCHDTKDNAGCYRFIPDSRTIIIIVVSFLFYTSYFTGITILVMF